MAAKALPGLEIPRRLVFPPFVEETLLESTLCSSLGMVSDLRSPTVLTVEAIAQGALRAAGFVAEAAPGWYDMQDLLGI